MPSKRYNLKKAIYLFSFLSVMNFSCFKISEKKVSSETSVVYKVDPLNMKNEKAYKISELIDTFKVVKLETSPNSIIGQITKILVAKNKIFIYDRYSEAIQIFDLTGKFIASIKRRGKGPEEYYKISDFTINTKDDQIVIADEVGRKLICYNLSGEFIRRIVIPKILFSRIACTENGDYLLYNQYQEDEEKNRYNFFKINESGKFIWSSFPYKNDSQRIGYAKNNYISGYGKDLLYIPLTDNTIYSFKNDTFSPAFKVDFGRFNVTETDLIELNAKSLPDKVLHIEQLHQNNKTVYLNYFFRNILPDAIIDKKSHHILRYTWFDYDKPFIAFAAPILATYKNMFVSCLQASDVQKRLNYFKKIHADQDSEKLVKDYSSEIYDLSKINKMDNPVVFLYNFKNF